ncbi:MAG TPA: glycosyltransferase family 2 protein [Casimicrobiaceae bacterium]|jgi:hypothetical protein
MLPKVGIIVLNWNNWRDTLECLESVYRLDYPAVDVIVCDNASTDESVTMIRRWAAGTVLSSTCSADARLRALTNAPVQKPLPVATMEEGQAIEFEATPSIALTILRLGRNGGYAAGNNAGLRLAQSRGAKLFWILNNDTVVTPAALSALVERTQADRSIGLCGSLLLFYGEPDRVQAAGGAVYRRFTAIPEILGAGQAPDTLPSPERIEKRMSYVVGASLLATAEFVDAVGPMCEDYFLYFEELDWVMRSQGRFRLGFAPQSVVYHKEGASAGSDANWRTRSAISDLCAVRSRLLITRRFFLPYYPVVFATIVAAFFRRLLRGQPERARQVLRILLGPESYRLPLPDRLHRRDMG